MNICQTLDCKKGEIITARHNNLCDGDSNLESKDFTPPHVHDDPIIYTGCVVCRGNDKLKGYPSNYELKLKGGILIRDLRTQGTESIHNMRVMNTDATSNHSQNPKKCLETAEK